MLGSRQDKLDLTMTIKSKKQESTLTEIEKMAEQKKTRTWDDDPRNPYNWPTVWKTHQVLMVASAAFTTSIGVSIMSPAQNQLMEEFGIESTVAILPLSVYAFALGLGPVLGGPISEAFGRLPVYLGSTLLGSLFTIGVGFSRSFPALCILRFLAGFCFAPSLAVAAGTVNEVFRPEKRAIPATICILTPFLGPGLGPVFGSLLVSHLGWQWTQWTILFSASVTLMTMVGARETFHTTIMHRHSGDFCLPLASSLPSSAKLKLFATSSIFLPIRMLVAEPIVAFICLYVACGFAILFSLFAAVPLVFQEVYMFNTEDSGLAFLSIVVGCLLGTLTLLLCDILLYRRKALCYSGQQVPPEFRLYPSLIGSLTIPVSLFWFGWSAQQEISWASPVLAIMFFAWGNLCVFVSSAQYIVDTYHGSIVASAMSANSLARYGLAAVFPLFTVQMYTNLGLEWASSLLGLITVAIMPFPWILFLRGDCLRTMSKLTLAQSQNR